MLKTHIRTAAMAGLASLALVGLSACGGSSSTKADTTASTVPATTVATTVAATVATTETTTDAPAATGAQPAWAKPATDGGDKIGTVEAGDITVDIYQVGVTKATKTGQFVDPDTKKPLLDEGDDIVFVNYVVTNTGAPIDLGASFVNIRPKYDDWKYLQGMDSIVDSSLFEEQNVNSDVLAKGGFKDPGVYTLGKGEKYSVGENFRYQKDSPITFKVTVTPVDAKGKLIHDEKLEGSGNAVIK